MPMPSFRMKTKKKPRAKSSPVPADLPFADRLKAERTRIGASQAQLGALFLGLDGTPEIGKQQVYGWEKGERTPPGWVQRLMLTFLKQTAPLADGAFDQRGRPASQ